MKKALFALSAAATSLTLAFAQTNINITNVAQQGQVNGGALLNLLALAQELINRAIPFLIGIAVIVFFWFLIQFIFKSDDPGKRADSLKGMGLSIVAIFVMVSIWGIIGLLGSLVGVGQGGNIPVPGAPRAN